MRVLAFDASSTTGWASFADARSVPVLGSFELKPRASDYGSVALDMMGKVRSLIEQHKPQVVGFEAPIFLPRDRWHTRRLLGCLVNVIELAAAMRDLRCIEVDPSKVKACLGGKGADKAQQIKAAILMGWPVKNDHEADACGVALGVYGYLTEQRWVGAR